MDSSRLMPWQDQAFIKLHSAEISYLLTLLDDRAPATKEWERTLASRLEAAQELISTKQRPTVFDRLDEIDSGQAAEADNIVLDNIVQLSYSWSDPNNTGAGYEKLVVKKAPRIDEKGRTCSGGGSDYSGVYHPNVVCETHDGRGYDGVCIHCGRTLF